MHKINHLNSNIYDKYYFSKIFKNHSQILGLRKKNFYKNSSQNYPLISIITVVRNGKKLEKTIKSVINQKYKNIEYIIINAGNSIENLQTIVKFQNKIDICVNQKDKGIYYGMNKGIKLTTGDYIGFLNCDDIYYNNAINILVKYITKFPNAQFIFGSVKKKERINHSFHPNKLKWKFNIYSAHSVGFFIKSSAQKLIGLYDTKFKYSSDYDLIYRMIVKYKLNGISTKRNEIFGYFAPDGYSSKTTYFQQMFEEIRIRYHNNQNLFYILIILIKKLILYFIKKKLIDLKNLVINAK